MEKLKNDTAWGFGGNSAIARNSYLILSFLLLSLMISRTANGFWVGDFWEHAAVVRELATHPVQPGHPQLTVSAPHAFFSPYALGIGLFSRLTGLPPVDSLALAGIINLILFLLAIRWVVLSLVKEPQEGNRASFYALLFILILWGNKPWSWSGFFHLNVLGYILPYPSTFAMALALLGFSIEMRRLENGNQWLLGPLTLMAAMILLCHPTTAMVFYFVLSAIHLDHRQRSGPRRSIDLAIALGAATLIVSAWPYFSFWDLVFAQSAEFNDQSSPLYEKVFINIWPCLFALPIIGVRLRQNRLDPLGVSFLCLLSIYLLSWWTGSWGFGRIISAIAMIAQISIAMWAAKVETNRRLESNNEKAGYLALAGIIIICAYTFYPAVKRALPGQEKSNRRQYSFLGDHVGPSDVILSDIATSWMTPVFAGKVIATHHSLYWVNDIETRREDLRTFFDLKTTSAQRHAITEKYSAKFILLDNKNVRPEAPREAELLAFGPTVYQDSRSTLIRLKQPRAVAPSSQFRRTGTE